ncbi:MAG: glycerol kinase GlpK, partial [Coriobacteriales bacterium]|nr:glycerol kinase GlpK [Coriobacteriales bacterium]
MAKDLILALDQGTTSSRALLFDQRGSLVDSAQYPFSQLYPQPGWVEHDPMEIMSTQLAALTGVLVNAHIDPDRIAAVGITNQRETTVLWHRQTGLPIANAIVWQCRRTAAMVEQLCADAEVSRRITDLTGLVPDAYFSASKIAWLLDHTPGARELAKQGELAFGTIDSWLVYALTGGAVHATDVTNASRTMLFDIHKGVWDSWLLELFNVPASLLPEVKPSAADYGLTVHPSVPKGLRIASLVGDQQAALFGQRCFTMGEAKNTLGTGAFLLMHTGQRACTSKNRLVTTVAASVPEQSNLEYALEGSVFVAGALVQWLRDELGLISTAAESEDMAVSVPDSGGVHVVPAFTGLGAPWWDADARGAILGLTRGATKEHIVRAALESLAYQSADLIAAFEDDADVSIKSLKVDGGAAANSFLVQFMADLLGIPIDRPESPEATGLGAAFLAGLTSGLWQDQAELLALDLPAQQFVP